MSDSFLCIHYQKQFHTDQKLWIIICYTYLVLQTVKISFISKTLQNIYKSHIPSSDDQLIKMYRLCRRLKRNWKHCSTIQQCCHHKAKIVLTEHRYLCGSIHSIDIWTIAFLNKPQSVHSNLNQFSFNPIVFNFPPHNF